VTADQKSMLRSLIIEFEYPIKVKDVVDSFVMERQQYFRNSKPVKNDFITKIRDEGQVILEETIDLGESKLVPEGKKVKVLFYQKDDDESLHMMIGLGKIKNNENSSDSDHYDSEIELSTI